MKSIPSRVFSAVPALCLVAMLASYSARHVKPANAEPRPPASVITVDAKMEAPLWAVLERRILDEAAAAMVEFYGKYYDDRGYVQCVLRWGADDGPDDAFENFAGWPEFHALGGSDVVLREALRVFNRMGLSVPTDAKYLERARRFAGFYMGEDPEAPNYDPRHKLIRSLINGSRGPMLRKATSIDWVGDPFDVQNFSLVHNERNFGEMLAHYEEYGDVIGDSFLNLVATTLPLNAYLATGDAKYKKWIVDYMDAWLDRMKRNNGIIPSFVDLDGRIGGPEGKWWNNAYGWGFSPVNPVTGRRENRNRIPRALVGFNNALFVTGDQKYVDAWRNMMNAVNSHATTVNGRLQYPTMYGSDGWFGWQPQPWNVGALEVWYWSMRPDDQKAIGEDSWIAYLNGRNPTYPETALKRDLQTIQTRLTQMRRDTTIASQRLADNMLDFNPAAVDALIRLTLGGLPPGREGGLLNARLRYFDPDRKRAGLPEDVAALVSNMTDTDTFVTLVNLNKAEPRSIVVQGGAYAEHRIESAEVNGKLISVRSPSFTLKLAPSAGATLTLKMKRYSEKATVSLPEALR